MSHCSKRQHVPLPEYQANLNAFIDRLEELGAQVIVITPPPVDEAARIKLAKQVHTGRCLCKECCGNWSHVRSEQGP